MHILDEYLVKLGFAVDKTGLSAFSSAIATARGAAIAISATAGAIGAAAIGMAMPIKKAANELDELNDLAYRVNDTVSNIRELSYVATLSGSSSDAAKSSLESLFSNAGLAAQGLGRAKKIFDDLHISVKNTDGSLKTATQLLSEVGTALSPLSKAEQAGIAEKLGIDKTLVQAIVSNTDDLRKEHRKIMSAVGVNLDDAAISAAELNDEFDSLTSTIHDIFLGESSKGFSFLTSVISWVKEGLIGLIPVFNAVGDAMSDALKYSKWFVAGLKQIIAEHPGVLTALKFIGAAFAGILVFTSPLVASVLAVGSALLLIQDFLNWLDGDQSLINWGAQFDTVKSRLIGVRDLFVELPGVITGAFAGIGAIIDANIIQPVSRAIEHVMAFKNAISTFAGIAGRIAFTPGGAFAAARAVGASTFNINTNINHHGSDAQAGPRIAKSVNGVLTTNLVRYAKPAAK